MIFKYQRVNVPNREQECINIYLTKRYVDKGNFTEIIKSYEDGRECQQHQAYLDNDEIKQLKDNGFRNTTWALF
ncbi:hypothetical protein [Rickettsia amblyommatis]|nr:hypothetical protein [Rickettsia amblyommatis]ALA62316.1 hypothetical protein AL573_07565 [Rickettsia amblyommatis]